MASVVSSLGSKPMVRQNTQMRGNLAVGSNNKQRQHQHKSQKAQHSDSVQLGNHKSASAATYQNAKLGRK